MESERNTMERIVELVEEKNQLVEQLEQLRLMFVLFLFKINKLQTSKSLFNLKNCILINYYFCYSYYKYEVAT